LYKTSNKQTAYKLKLQDKISQSWMHGWTTVPFSKSNNEKTNAILKQYSIQLSDASGHIWQYINSAKFNAREKAKVAWAPGLMRTTQNEKEHMWWARFIWKDHKIGLAHSPCR